MRKLIALIVAGVLPFAGAAYVSWKWQAAEAPPAKEVEHAGETDAAPEKQQASVSKQPEKRNDHARSASSPNSPAPSAEEAVQLVANLRNQLASVRQREAQFASRQKQIDLVYQDIRSERATMEKLQQQIFAELRAAEKRWVTPKTPILRPRDSSPVLNTPRQLAVPAPEPNRNKDTPKAAAFTMPFSGILAGKLRQLIRPEIVDSVIAVIRKIEQQPSKSPEGQAIPGPSLKPPPNPTDKTGKTG